MSDFYSSVTSLMKISFILGISSLYEWMAIGRAASVRSTEVLSEAWSAASTAICLPESS